MLWKFDHPNIILYYNNSYELDLYMKFGRAVDLTDYNIYEKGLYFVYSMGIEIEGWVFTNFNAKTILTIIVDVYYRTGTAGNYTDILLDEFTVTADS